MSQGPACAGDESFLLHGAEFTIDVEGRNVDPYLSQGIPYFPCTHGSRLPFQEKENHAVET